MSSVSIRLLSKQHILKLYSCTPVKVNIAASYAQVVPALINLGLVPSAPLTPSVAFTVNVLELFRVIQMRCPCLSEQAFVKSLCDLHGVSSSNLTPSFAELTVEAGLFSCISFPSILNCLRPVPSYPRGG